MGENFENRLSSYEMINKIEAVAPLNAKAVDINNSAKYSPKEKVDAIAELYNNPEAILEELEVAQGK